MVCAQQAVARRAPLISGKAHPEFHVRVTLHAGTPVTRRGARAVRLPIRSPWMRSHIAAPAQRCLNLPKLEPSDEFDVLYGEQIELLDKGSARRRIVGMSADKRAGLKPANVQIYEWCIR